MTTKHNGSLDSDEPNGAFEGIEDALRRAANKVHAESARTGRPIVVWKDGRVQHVIGTPDAEEE